MNARASRARHGNSGSARKAQLDRRHRRRRWLAVGLPGGAVAVILVVALAMSASGGGGKASARGEVTASGPPRASALSVGESIPDFSAPGLAGGRVSWASFQGTPTVLVGWAPWCPHCQKELPVLGRVLKDYPGVRVVSMVTAIGLHPGPASADFMDQHGLAFPVAVDDSTGTLASAFGLSSFPTVYYIGPDGTVRDVVVGEDTEAAMRSRFQDLAQQAAA